MLEEDAASGELPSCFLSTCDCVGEELLDRFMGNGRHTRIQSRKGRERGSKAQRQSAVRLARAFSGTEEKEELRLESRAQRVEKRLPFLSLRPNSALHSSY